MRYSDWQKYIKVRALGVGRIKYNFRENKDISHLEL